MKKLKLIILFAIAGIISHAQIAAVSNVSVSFSATPTFTANAPVTNFDITLSGNVTSSTFALSPPSSAPTIGSLRVCQDGTGGHTFVPPAGSVGFGAIDATASKCSTATWKWDGTLRATSAFMGDNGTVISGGSGGGVTDPGGNGVMSRSALNTTIARTITGTANLVTVTNGDGVAGNPTLTVGSNVARLDQGNIFGAGSHDFSGASHLRVPNATGYTPTLNGHFGYDSTANSYKGYVGATVKTFAFLDSNITGTAANLSGTPALPNGVTATTQTAGDNSNKLADTAFVATAVSTRATCTGDLEGTAPGCTVAGLKAAPFCAGFTPTNGQTLQYTTGGTPDPCWAAATTSVSPGGSDTYVQFRDAGAFAGDANFTYDKTSHVATATGGFQGGATFSHGGGCVDPTTIVTPATNTSVLFFDSTNSCHLSRKNSAGAVTDEEAGALPTASGNKVIASPADGTSAQMAARALVVKDLPGAYECASAAASGTAYSCTPTNAPASYVHGEEYTMILDVDNTGAITFDFGPGAKAVKRAINGSITTALLAGEGCAGQIVHTRYDQSNDIFQMDSPICLGPMRTLGASFGSPGGSALSAGATVYEMFSAPFSCQIRSWDIKVAPSGTATIKVWKVATGTAIPTSAGSINTSGIAISANTSIHSTTLSDFTTTQINENDQLAFNLYGVSSASYVSVQLNCK